MKPLWIFEDLYNQNFYFLRNAGPTELSAFVKKQFGLEASFSGGWAGKCASIINEKGEARYVIAIRKWDKKSRQSLSCLMHEVNHAAMFTLEERGVRVTVEDHEAFNYLAQFVFEGFLNLAR